MEPMKPVEPIESIVNSPVNDKYESLNANPVEILNNQSGLTSLHNIVNLGFLAAGTITLVYGIESDGNKSVLGYISTALSYGAVANSYIRNYFLNNNPPPTSNTPGFQ